MTLPRLLLVDDSEAILAFERAALAPHHSVTTAANGRLALERLREERFDAVVLDLSMPEMDGEEVLSRMRADASLVDVPVVVVSSEVSRGEAMLKRGAAAFLAKPIQADALVALVGRTLDGARERRRSQSLAILHLEIGTTRFGVPITAVRTVLPAIATKAVPGGPAIARRAVELHGRPLLVVEAAELLGDRHLVPIEERALVVVEHAGLEIALSVDRVRDPEEVPPEEVVLPDALGGSRHGALRDVLVALVRTKDGYLPVIAPHAILSAELTAELRKTLEAFRRDSAAAAAAETGTPA